MAVYVKLFKYASILMYNFLLTLFSLQMYVGFVCSEIITSVYSNWWNVGQIVTHATECHILQHANFSSVLNSFPLDLTKTQARYKTGWIG
jgi:hypothetical protein